MELSKWEVYKSLLSNLKGRMKKKVKRKKKERKEVESKMKRKSQKMFALSLPVLILPGEFGVTGWYLTNVNGIKMRNKKEWFAIRCWRE